MPRNGSGVYVLPPSNPVSPGTVIESTWANDTMSDIANALTNSISVDGQTIPSANLPMGGYHHTNVSDPSLRNQYLTLGMAQDGRHQRIQSITGVNDIVGTLVGGGTSYVAGALISFFAPATNTGSMTVNYNGIGARSLVDTNGLPLAPGEITGGEFVLALYTGTEFRLLTSVDTAVAADLYNLSISGEIRPPSGSYPAMTIATATTVNVPAGEAWIVPPGNDTDDAVKVTWAAQTITMQFLSTSFTTFVVVDDNGVIQQIPGRALGPNFRHFAVLGVVEHITGVVNNVITRPSIFGDDGYRSRDQASLLANTIINGGLVQPNSVSTLQLDVAQGTIFIPGGTANTVDSPNTFNIPPQANIPFRPLAGQNTLSASTVTVPVGSYDANGSGVVAALPNPGDATVHRLFYLYGQYVLAYGQQVYSSVENALSFLAWDRTKFKKSIYLADATLMAEIVAIRSATNLNLIAQGAVICPGGLNFSIGSPGGIAEAPIDGFPYGRKNAAWSRVLEAVSPTITTDATISGPIPVLKEIVTPANSAGSSGLQVFNAANKWFGIETVFPDDKMYMRSYDPATGVLRFTTIWDMVTGIWELPVGLRMNGNVNMLGSVRRFQADFSDATQNNRMCFVTNVANGNTIVSAIPNGTALSSSFKMFGGTNPDNASYLQITCDGNVPGNGFNAVNSGANGIGTVRDLAFIVQSGPVSERFRLPAAANRFQADFSNATLANRLAFQTSTVNGATAVSVIPNGTSNVSQFCAFGSSDMNNSNTGALVQVGAETRLASAVSGSAVLGPMKLLTGGVTRLEFRTDNITDIAAGDAGGFFCQLNLRSVDNTRHRYFRIASDNSFQFTNNANTAITQIFTDGGDMFCSGLFRTSTNTAGGEARFYRAKDANLTYAGMLETENGTSCYVGRATVQGFNTFAGGGDNIYNCGWGLARWIAVYAINGTIITSDEREKQDVRPLTVNEIKCACELAGMGITYRWIADVEKDPNAPIHCGHIAQRVMECMERHDLNWRDYYMVRYDEWDDMEAVVNEEGHVIRPAAKAGNRYSLVYEELLSFIVRGQHEHQMVMEARLQALEARL